MTPTLARKFLAPPQPSLAGENMSVLSDVH